MLFRMKRLKIIGIDKEKCIKCEKCIPSCSPRLFAVHRESEVKKEIAFNDPYRFCFRCGHCITICPTDAIIYENAEPPFIFEEASSPEKILSYEDLMKLVRSRKSIRVYQDKPVPKKEIEAVLEAMRYAPSASNRQRIQYLVIIDKKKIASLSKDIVKLILKVRFVLKLKYVLAPFVQGSLRRRLLSPRTKVNLDRLVERTEKGEDLIFFHAPCVIIAHSTPYSRMSGVDGGIVITHGTLAALTRGLGTCWNGFAQEYFERSIGAKKKWGIPKKHSVYGVFILGYPDIEFRGGVARRPLKVNWME